MKTHLLLAASALSASLVAQAQDHGLDKRVYVSAQATYNYFDSDSGLQDSEGYGLSIGKPIFSWLDLELQAFTAEATDNADNDSDYQGYGLAARLYPGRYVMPFYFLAGYSIGDDQSQSATEDSSFIDVGAGYTHAISQGGTSLRAEYRARRSETDGVDASPVNHLVSLGIEIPFGAAKPLNATKEGEPTYRNTEVSHRLATSNWESGAPCLDADFDGVCDFGDQCANTPVGIIANGLGCTPDVPLVTQLADGPMVLEGVEFDFNSDDLTTTSMPILDRAAETLKANPGIPVEIAGHTDNWGSFTYNFNLSTLRAKRVYKYLTDKGVSEHRLTFKGYGESEPVEENTFEDGSDNPEGRARNRRVELRADLK